MILLYCFPSLFSLSTIFKFSFRLLKVSGRNSYASNCASKMFVLKIVRGKFPQSLNNPPAFGRFNYSTLHFKSTG
jgi:hypothetical protein